LIENCWWSAIDVGRSSGRVSTDALCSVALFTPQALSLVNQSSAMTRQYAARSDRTVNSSLGLPSVSLSWMCRIGGGADNKLLSLLPKPPL
jgi:hypothetical protein